MAAFSYFVTPPSGFITPPPRRRIGIRLAAAHRLHARMERQFARMFPYSHSDETSITHPPQEAAWLETDSRAFAAHGRAEAKFPDLS
jgi:hypothetical protein